jgi:hypothetical protein
MAIITKEKEKFWEELSLEEKVKKIAKMIEEIYLELLSKTSKIEEKILEVKKMINEYKEKEKENKMGWKSRLRKWFLQKWGC